MLYSFFDYSLIWSTQAIFTDILRASKLDTSSTLEQHVLISFDFWGE